MGRDEFIRRLEELLADIPEEERDDAIAFYRDYLDEAGTDREEAVIRGFGSPERIAAMIRTDLLGGMDGAGEFTEQGFADDRFDRPAYPAAAPQKEKSSSGTEETGQKKEEHRYSQYRREENSRYTGYSEQKEKPEGNFFTRHRTLCYVLIGILCVIAAPAVLSLAFGTLNGVFGILMALLFGIIGLGLLTVIAAGGGVVMAAYGVFRMFGHFWSGLLLVGAGAACLGIGILLALACVLFYGKLLPWLFHKIAGFFRSLGDRAGRSSV